MTCVPRYKFVSGIVPTWCDAVTGEVRNIVTRGLTVALGCTAAGQLAAAASGWPLRNAGWRTAATWRLCWRLSLAVPHAGGWLASISWLLGWRTVTAESRGWRIVAGWPVPLPWL